MNASDLADLPALEITDEMVARATQCLKDSGFAEYWPGPEIGSMLARDMLKAALLREAFGGTPLDPAEAPQNSSSPPPDQRL